MMHLNLDTSWKQLLEEEFTKEYYLQLTEFVANAYKTSTCFPPYDAIFSAFNYCKFDTVKVVLIGQDPYHGKGQANGLCFSVQDDVKHPPSLRNIFKELETDVAKPYPKSGDLTAWAKQGVLLLNATLTVMEANAGSHQKKGWEQFTDAVISIISARSEGVVFLLWGGFAHKKARLINSEKHYILKAGHPSPLSANRGYWFGNKHFSKTNELLLAQGKKPVDW